MKEGLFYILKGLLSKNGIKVDNEELKLQLFGHPTYPSLNSLTGVLDHFNIPNLALEIPKSEENIHFLPAHFIAHFSKNSSERFVLVSKKADNFHVSTDGKKTELLSLGQFMDAWSGIVLAIDAEEYTNVENPFNISQIVIDVSPIVLALGFSFLSTDFHATIHFLLSMFGIIICGLIIRHEFGSSSIIIDKICSGRSKKLSCSEVMQSKGGKLFGLLKLSDLGILYFLTISLFSLLLALNVSDYTLIYQFSILAIPFTLYSIFYQLLIVRKWCLLCLSIVTVLIAQAGVAFVQLNLSEFLSFNTGNLIQLAFSAYLSIILWIYITPKIKKNHEFLNLQINYNRFKRNYEVFNILLSRSTPISTKISSLKEITFGSPDADLEIVIITNPLCGFCREAHKVIHQVLKTTNDVNLIVRFNISEGKHQVANRIASKLLELYFKKGKQECLIAMDAAYNHESPLNWLKKYGETEAEDYYKILNSEKDWCVENNIHFTPEILFNGKAYPKEYEFEDLQYFLEYLMETEEHIHSEPITP